MLAVFDFSGNQGREKPVRARILRDPAQGKEDLAVTFASLRLCGSTSYQYGGKFPQRRKDRKAGCYSEAFDAALETTFQISGSVLHACPRCCGRKPKRTTRPFPTFTSASAI